MSVIQKKVTDIMIETIVKEGNMPSFFVYSSFVTIISKRKRIIINFKKEECDEEIYRIFTKYFI